MTSASKDRPFRLARARKPVAALDNRPHGQAGRRAAHRVGSPRGHRRLDDDRRAARAGALEVPLRRGDAPARRRGEALRRHGRAVHRRRALRAVRRAERARRRRRARGARGARDAGRARRATRRTSARRTASSSPDASASTPGRSCCSPTTTRRRRSGSTRSATRSTPRRACSPRPARGGVAVSPATAQQIEGAFELESIGELELKGKSAPIEVFRVAGEREREAREISPLVGRDRELAVLDDVMADLADGRGAIVAITGEPGHRQEPPHRGGASPRARTACASSRRRASRTRRTFRTTRCASCCARASASAWPIRRRACGSS